MAYREKVDLDLVEKVLPAIVGRTLTDDERYVVSKFVGAVKALEDSLPHPEYRVLDREGCDAIVFRGDADGCQPFVVAHGFDEGSYTWSHGTYCSCLDTAARELRPVHNGTCPSCYSEDIEGYGIAITPDFAHQACECLECGCSWVDHYRIDSRDVDEEEPPF